MLEENLKELEDLKNNLNKYHEQKEYLVYQW